MKKGKQLPCEHAFHNECLEKWLKGKFECPVCRKRPDGKQKD